MRFMDHYLLMPLGRSSDEDNDFFLCSFVCALIICSDGPDEYHEPITLYDDCCHGNVVFFRMLFGS